MLPIVHDRAHQNTASFDFCRLAYRDRELAFHFAPINLAPFDPITGVTSPEIRFHSGERGRADGWLGMADWSVASRSIRQLDANILELVAFDTGRMGALIQLQQAGNLMVCQSSFLVHTAVPNRCVVWALSDGRIVLHCPEDNECPFTGAPLKALCLFN